MDTGLPTSGGLLFKKMFSIDANEFMDCTDDIDTLVSLSLGELYKRSMFFLEQKKASHYRMTSHYRMSGYWEGSNCVWIDVDYFLKEGGEA